MEGRSLWGAAVIAETGTMRLMEALLLAVWLSTLDPQGRVCLVAREEELVQWGCTAAEALTQRCVHACAPGMQTLLHTELWQLHLHVASPELQPTGASGPKMSTAAI